MLNHGVEMEKTKVDAVTAWPQPCINKNCRDFLVLKFHIVNSSEVSAQQLLHWPTALRENQRPSSGLQNPPKHSENWRITSPVPPILCYSDPSPSFVMESWKSSSTASLCLLFKYVIPSWTQLWWRKPKAIGNKSCTREMAILAGKGKTPIPNSYRSQEPWVQYVGG